jgi:DNA repair protein RadC
MKKYPNLVKDPQLSEVKLSYTTSMHEQDRPILNGPEDVYGYLCDIWDMERLELQEEFIVVVMNGARKVLGWTKISMGGKSATIVDVSMIIQVAVLSNACSVILAHSHPSGTQQPSASDINLTRRIKDALNLIGITLDDHLILVPGNYYSFRDKGLI